MYKLLGISVVVVFGMLLWQLWPTSKLEVVVAFLDVGQGDAIFIESPTGRQMLVDGGPDAAVLGALNEVMPWLDRSLDVVVATHPDADHIGGLVPVLEAYAVERVLTTGATAETDIFQGVYDAVLDEGSEVVLVRRGSVIDMGGGLMAEVLFPEQVFEVGDRNVNSLVMRLEFGDTSWLLTGDAGIEQEEYLVETMPEKIQVNVLKLGHHGSKSSSGDALLAATQPDVAVVSAGRDNRYGHPDKEVLDRLHRYGIPVLGTPTSGTIMTMSDGQTINVK